LTDLKIAHQTLDTAGARQENSIFTFNWARLVAALSDIAFDAFASGANIVRFCKFRPRGHHCPIAQSAARGALGRPTMNVPSLKFFYHY
jgi:hypothetical protein